MPIVAAPNPAPAPLRPPDAYIESPHGLRRMSADFGGRWCLPAAELPPTLTTPAGSTLLCSHVIGDLTTYGTCVRRMALLPEVWARPGETVRFHIPAGIGTPAVTIGRGDVVQGFVDPVTSWTATAAPADDPPSLVRIAASSERGSVVYMARVVTGDDPAPPAVRLNARRARGVLEVTAPPGSTVVACVQGRAGAASTEPLRRRDVSRTLTIPVTGARLTAATVSVRGPNGVRTIARIGSH